MGKETFDQIREKIGDTHSFLAEGLTIPFINQTNNSRVQMASSQINQAVQMRESDLPLVFTGFENQVGKYSSGYRLLNGEWMVLKKFVKNPLNYVMIIQNTKTREYDLVTRREVEHLTEIFGYELNNDEIDSVDSGDIIEDHVIYRDNNYDEDMNLKYGKNMRIAYLPYKGSTNEDSFVFSESAAKAMSTPFIEKVKVRVNTNDILLNLYGDGDNSYKTFPNVGEFVREDGILVGTRRISYSEIINKFQDDQLQSIMEDDSIKYVNRRSRVVDIDIWNNNDLDKMRDEVYNDQVLRSYGGLMDYYNEVVKYLKPIMEDFSKDVTRNLRNFYNEVASFRDPISEFKEEDRRFDNLVIEFTISYLEPINLGSKLTSRFGNY